MVSCKNTKKENQQLSNKRNVGDDDGALCTLTRLIACWPRKEITTRVSPKTNMQKIAMTEVVVSALIKKVVLKSAE